MIGRFGDEIAAGRYLCNPVIQYRYRTCCPHVISVCGCYKSLEVQRRSQDGEGHCIDFIYCFDILMGVEGMLL